MDPKTPLIVAPRKASVREDLELLLDAARANFAKRAQRQTADALCAAHAGAEQHGLHREAAQLRKAIMIFASGGRPHLLTHIQPLFTEGKRHETHAPAKDSGTQG